ncbi:MTH1187 family thiamine-binding protein [Sediminitomix flava]|uniref:Uncharacterized protein (TIGR00106 family) n=1 Tax=Sediminitomix flava TaxID=379075 RepID=A0A315ZDN2_SEDFL|nr:MTH1187 family thiamine-binding protein [Sediminitomix flava]PWJ43240.1 uncharacterized protein (TIGR00106 family) [Sediminitomix flava]
MSVLVEFAMFPTDKGESMSAHVSKVIEAIRESGVNYQLTPMGTIFETEAMPEALALIQQCHDVLAPNSNRIYSTVKFDIRKGKSDRMKKKIASIEGHIGEVNK